MSDVGSSGITASTRVCAVLGHPIHHSASPAMQNAGLAALGLNWVYLAFDVDPAHLPEVLRGAKAMGLIGLNLTVPHKLLALDQVDVLHDSARLWGAVNTIRFEAADAAGEWKGVADVPPDVITAVRSHGYNTDADAIVRALGEDLGCGLTGQTVLLLGAGGAGRAAGLRLAQAGVRRLYLVNRTEAKANVLAADVRERFPGVEVCVGYPEGTVDLVLNATSLGLSASDPLPMELDRCPWSRVGAVYDMIYRPAETPLLARARAAGCRVSNGLGMLLYQGAKALEIWSGRPAPVAVMRTALRTNIYGAGI